MLHLTSMEEDNPLKEIFKEIGSRPILNKENIIDEVKDVLRKKDPFTYNQWREEEFNVNHVFNSEATLLHFAAVYGHVDIVEALINNGVNVDAVDISRRTSLQCATSYGQVDVMKILIENGANVNVVDVNGKTPLHIAAEETRECLAKGIVKLLIENGADVNVGTVYDGETPLHIIAGFTNGIEIVETLIEHGANVKAVDSDGSTPLHRAAKYGCLEIVHALIKHGADVNAKTKHKKDTPLHLAVQNNHLEIVEYLTDKGGINDVQNFTG